MTSPTTTLVLVHGWGFDATFWEPLAAQLPDFATVTVDLGFTGRPDSPEIPTDGRRVAVGHSLGLLWLLKARPFTWDALVSVNGFPRFVEGDGFGPAQAPRVIERMIRRLGQDPDRVATDFLALCGAPPPQGRLDTAALEQGLKWLLEWDARAALDRDPEPALILAARNDPVVPLAMTEAAFPDRPGHTIAWHDDGGHLLPLTDPRWCAERITEFLARTV